MKYLKGFVIGFLFGIIGMWILALLALMLPFFEIIGSVLFAPGRWLAAVTAGSNAGTLAVILLMLANGVLYGLIGMGIQALFSRQSTTFRHKH
jgi:hypothetical protein